MASRLSDRFKINYDELPWREIKGLRSLAVPEYDSISMDDI